LKPKKDNSKKIRGIPFTACRPNETMKEDLMELHKVMGDSVIALNEHRIQFQRRLANEARMNTIISVLVVIAIAALAVYCCSAYLANLCEMLFGNIQKHELCIGWRFHMLCIYSL
jgi:hypothetical protein